MKNKYFASQFKLIKLQLHCIFETVFEENFQPVLNLKKKTTL